MWQQSADGAANSAYIDFQCSLGLGKILCQVTVCVSGQIHLSVSQLWGS